MTHPSVATRELLAPREDVWAFVSTAGRLADWWPGVISARDDGACWIIQGDERPGIGVFAQGAPPDQETRQESVAVEKAPPQVLRLHFDRTGYDVELKLDAIAPRRTSATLSIATSDQHESFVERLEESVLMLGGPPGQAFAEARLERLYELCQTGADA
jgi:hypothetical protein